MNDLQGFSMSAFSFTLLNTSYLQCPLRVLSSRDATHPRYYYRCIFNIPGHLDRVIHGITAEEILNNCDENATPMESLVNPNITLTQALKRRNLATFKNLAQQKLQIQTGTVQQSSSHRNDYLKQQTYPMFIQGIRANLKDPDIHILFFDTESLIG